MCNIHCSRQSLMKFTPVNGVNVCELVMVKKMDAFITCFNCQIMYQVVAVGALQQVSFTNITVSF